MDKYARFRYQPCIPLGTDGRKVTGSPEHAALSRKAPARVWFCSKTDSALCRLCAEQESHSSARRLSNT